MSTAEAIGSAIREARVRLRMSPGELSASARVDATALAGQEAGSVLLSVAKLDRVWDYGYFVRDHSFREELIDPTLRRPSAADRATMPPLPRSDGRSSLLLAERTREAHERLLVTDGRARELLGLSVHDELPWEMPRDAPRGEPRLRAVWFGTWHGDGSAMEPRA